MASMVNGLEIDANFLLYLSNLRGKDFRWEIPFKTYIGYRKRKRPMPNAGDDFRRFVTPKEDILQKIVADITLANITVIPDMVDYCQLVMDFVHRIPYQDKKEHYTKYPIETLCEFGGNCVDMSVLGATLLNIGGIETCFIDFPEHLAVGVNVPARGGYVMYRGQKYYVAEMSGTRELSRSYSLFRVGDSLDRDLSKARIYTAKPRRC